ncbi:hypothetical protein TL16_g11723 [Triparma laevis f. inornata]|uniref:GYF domain-containing protein n=1 Tax=Triparma laevis f. inornata TaxID=1714386 RepID=A0A9W7EUG4_9STRA|nr:hypothetical protein TL16_g11723 [Triparma laevis f. inornata]
MTDSTKASLFNVMANLLQDTETVLKGLRRLGKLKNPEKQKKASGGYGKKKDKDKEKKKEELTPENTAAASAFNQLTEAADALLNAGETDIYEMTKEILLNQVDTKTSIFRGEESNVDAGDAGTTQWEYRGQDGNVHGPFPSKSMFEWVSKGYFTGVNAVDVRIWNGAVNKSNDTKKEDLKDDLMDDLADDLMDEGEEEKVEEKKEEKKEEWQRSDKVNFAGYC